MTLRTRPGGLSTAITLGLRNHELIEVQHASAVAPSGSRCTWKREGVPLLHARGSWGCPTEARPWRSYWIGPEREGGKQVQARTRPHAQERPRTSQHETG